MRKQINKKTYSQEAKKPHAHHYIQIIKSTCSLNYDKELG